MKFLPLLVLLAVSASLPLRSAETNAPAAPTLPVVQEDLTPFKTADGLWLRFQAIARERQPHDMTNSAALQAWTLERFARENYVAREFAKRYPDDKRRWSAEYKLADNAINLSRIGVQSEPYAEITKRLQSILAATNAGPSLQGSANLYLVLHDMQKVVDGKLAADVWAKQAAAHWEKYPRTLQNSGIISKALVSDRRSGTALIPALAAVGDTNIAPRAVLILEHQQVTKAAALIETDEPAARTQLAALAQEKNTNIATQARTVLDQLAALDKLKSAPLELKFTAVDKREVDLEKLRGKVVLITFWAGWHIPGHPDLAMIRDLYAKEKDKGFEVIGVSFDQFREPFDKTIAELKLPWPQYYDGLAFKNTLAAPLGVKSPPAYWLINKKGYLVDSRAKKDLAAKVEKLLAE
jgi:peroxiredoxin